LAKKDEAFFEDLRRQLDDLGLRTYWVTENDQTKLNYNVKIPGVRIITALSSLGLEFKVVLLLWVDQFASCCGHDLEEAAFARRQLYVAMTRAQDELHLFGHGNVAILDELQQSQSFEVVRARAASLGSEPIHEQKSARGHEQTLQVKFRKRHEPAL
jgi:superfamily I DNA/RNA helicase